MPRVGFEPKIPAFGRAKTVHALDPAVTVTARSHDKAGYYIPIQGVETFGFVYDWTEEFRLQTEAYLPCSPPRTPAYVVGSRKYNHGG
jgi:hypothetical protein